MIEELRDALILFREAEQALTDANEEENRTGLAPSNETFWHRDDAGVSVANVADRLMQELDSGQLMIVPVASAAEVARAVAAHVRATERKKS
ncbi:hypothetical protein K1T35_47495 (plasmid) [Pseudonocardia sp. DSM 110487]|uniref:hypothetical protein n=1 Tax=Pseudonocardia sp. DSM 110487 TaxID=2865833 RepID=UPI001C697B54|nr:hypothetical protein [Pseudonocardia sp. DSM 110487]QYN40995.1 hypothetical protein K1T35_47495 [Pseudonocardia sp. DSM 110487]